MFDAQKEIADARHYSDIRLMSVLQDSCAPQVTAPLDDLYTVFLPWSEGSSDTVNHSWEVSAVCWMYAKHLYDDIISKAYPIGLVISDWGGTTVRAWSPQSVTDECVPKAKFLPGQRENPEHIPKKEHAPIGDCMFNPNADAALYNTMIVPFKDMSFTGGLWYQGETDSGDPYTYPCLQDGMVRSWREMWGEDFVFIFTQLSTWDQGGYGALPEFRLKQEEILALTPNTAMITAADLGDPYDNPQGEIHPRNKTELGRRMSLAASSLIYNKAVPHMGPRIASVTVSDDDTAGKRVHVTFAEESCGANGIYLQAPQACPEWSAAKSLGCGKVLLVFEGGVTVESSVSVSSKVSIDIVPLTKVTADPVQLSYCYGDYPLMTVYNDVGAPLLPFVYTF
jgi:sialate O-acetylesterase